MALHCTNCSPTPQDHNDFCDKCRKQFQKLTLQRETQDLMDVVDDHGNNEVKPFAEHHDDDDDLKTTTTKGKGESRVLASVAAEDDSESDYDEDGGCPYCPNHDECMDSLMGYDYEIVTEIHKTAEANRIAAEKESEIEDEKPPIKIPKFKDPFPMQSRYPPSWQHLDFDQKSLFFPKKRIVKH